MLNTQNKRLEEVDEFSVSSLARMKSWLARMRVGSVSKKTETMNNEIIYKTEKVQNMVNVQMNEMSKMKFVD